MANYHKRIEIEFDKDVISYIIWVFVAIVTLILINVSCIWYSL